MVFLLILLSSIMILCLNIEKKEYVAPAFIFCASFVFSCLWATAYRKQWELDIHFNTFCVILGGVLEFVVVAYFTRWFLRKSSKRCKTSSYTVYRIVSIEIKRIYLIGIIVVEAFTVAFTLYEIVVATGISDISSALVYYNDITKFTEDSIIFPHAGLLFLLWDFVDAMGFWISFIIANKIVERKKPAYESLVLVLSMLSNVFRGARTNAICKLMAFLCILLILLRRKAENKKHSVSIKLIVAIIIAAVFFMLGFKQIGSMMGRTIMQSGTDYVAMYCGSEIKNLDTFLQEKHEGIDSFLDSQTFYVILKYIKPKLGITEKTLPVLPTRYINGIMLANVYTTFYQYIYDFGYAGLIILVGLMSILSQVAYEFSKSFKEKKTVPISLVIYGYIFPSLVLSFFSNKFYERQFSSAFIKYCIYWVLFNFVLVRIKIRVFGSPHKKVKCMIDEKP